MTAPTVCDVLVVGAGPAGVTVAHRLVELGRQVTMIDCGGDEETSATRDLREGAATGPVIKDYPTYLADSRWFGRGGAAREWARGARFWAMPYTLLDVVDRPEVGRGGWPRPPSDVETWSARAAASVGVPGALSPDASEVETAAGGRLRTLQYSFPPRSAVFADRLAALADHPRFTLLTHTTLVSAECRDQRVAITRLDSPDGPLALRPRTVVLAAGGIENARLLLLALEDGLPIDRRSRGQVGRHFMEHFHVRAGVVRSADPHRWSQFLSSYDTGGHGHARMDVLAVPVEVQRREGLLGATLQLVPGESYGGPPDELSLFLRAEQQPHASSAVTLDEAQDRLGRPRARLDWVPTDRDWHSVVRTAELLADALRATGRADPELLVESTRPWPAPPSDPADSPMPTWGHHHIGTTRMSADPAGGVVDPDGRVWGMSDLVVVGSSTFPTSSHANPTFMVVAEALRTAETLGRA